MVLFSLRRKLCVVYYSIIIYYYWNSDIKEVNKFKPFLFPQTMFPIDWKSLPSKFAQEFPEKATAAHSAPWSKPTLSNDKVILASEPVFSCVYEHT